MACLGHGIFVIFMTLFCVGALAFWRIGLSGSCNGGGGVIRNFWPMMGSVLCHLSKDAPDLSQKGMLWRRLTPWIWAMYGSGVHVARLCPVNPCFPAAICAAVRVASVETLHIVLV